MRTQPADAVHCLRVAIRYAALIAVLLAIGHLAATRTALGQSSGNTTSADPAVSSEPAFPESEAVKQAISEHFAGLKDRQPGDLLSTRDVSPLFPKLAKLGWTVAEEREITGMLLADGDLLVTQLRSTQGRKFARKVAALPGGYDRLDRLRKMPRGQQQLRELIEGPDGDKLIEYMTKTKQGRNLGRSLGQTGSGKDFNQPTGRLYTAADVEKRLLESYAAERARREKPAATR